MAMSTITINFQNASLVTGAIAITVSNGSFALDVASAFTIWGTVDFSSLYVTPDAINFNVAAATIDAEICIPLSAPGGSPNISVSDFTGTVTATWPTSTGVVTQPLLSGDMVTLSGFVN